MSGWNDADVDYLKDRERHRRQAEAGVRAQVAVLRQAGCPWSVIADALGVSRQAAHKRFRSQRVSFEDQPLPIAEP